MGPTSAETDREVLVIFYNVTSGPNWRDNTNWLSDLPIGTWHGVTTGDNGRVTGLEFIYKGLSGEIPAELGSLSNLEILYLHSNRLSGEIPAELGNLSNLRELYLGDNELSGEIPAELGNLSNLRKLYLRDNELSGEIPAELGNLSNLRELYLHSNRFSGCLPASLGSVSTNDSDRLGLPFC